MTMLNRLSLLPLIAFGGFLYVSGVQAAEAAQAPVPHVAVEASASSLNMPAYYNYHGHRYAYHYHGHYYNHRSYTGGHYRYY